MSTPQFHIDLSVQNIGSTQGPHLFSTQNSSVQTKTPQFDHPEFHTKHPSFPHRNPTVQHQKPLHSTPKTPQFNTPLSQKLESSLLYIELFSSEGCVELRVFLCGTEECVELRGGTVGFWCGTGGFWGLKRSVPFVWNWCVEPEIWWLNTAIFQNFLIE